MNVIVVGAGNAGRPVARLLNYAGHTVKITDPKNIEDFHMDVQKTLRLMESEGVELDLGVFEPSLDGIDTVYLSPTVPENAPAYKIVKEANLNVFSNDDFGRLADSFIDIDIIGITGSVGKTSTTHMVTEIFRTAGYQVWICSSMTQNLVSEVIVDGIIKGIPQKSDIAVLELPHGTAGLMAELKLKVGALLNIYEEHLSEFGGSMERYTQRKMFIAKNSENFITSIHCKDLMQSFTQWLRICLDTILPKNPNTLTRWQTLRKLPSAKVRYVILLVTALKALLILLINSETNQKNLRKAVSSLSSI